MPYRTELKRPDLKGHFPCSVCQKVFCHSSSLSRHRMQAHFKSYTCTQCNQEIPSSETLRSHMMRIHQIARMFMCRCCNWAFPDKTSLHLHTTSLTKTGNPGDVPVLARSTVEGDFTPNLDYTPSTSPTGTRESVSPVPLDEMKPPTQISTPQNPIQNAAPMPAAPNPFLTASNLLNVGIFPPALSNRLDLFQKLKSKSNAKADTNSTPTAPNLSQMDTSPQLNNWIANWFANNPFQMPMADVYPNLLMQNEKTKLSPNLKSHINGPTPPKRSCLDLKPEVKLQQNGAEKKSNSESKNGRNGGSHVVDSEAQSRLLSVIDNLFSVKTTNLNTSANAGNSPGERPNKRKARKPQQLSESFFFAISSAEDEQANIKVEFGDASEEKKSDGNSAEEQQPISNNEQPSPAISDSHTSGSSAQLTDSSTVSPKKCINCQVMKGKLEQTESRIQTFQKKVAELTEKIDLVEEQSRNQKCLKCTQAAAVDAQDQSIERLSKMIDEISELTSKAKELCDADDYASMPELQNLINRISEVTSQ